MSIQGLKCLTSLGKVLAGFLLSGPKERKERGAGSTAPLPSLSLKCLGGSCSTPGGISVRSGEKVAESPGEAQGIGTLIIQKAPIRRLAGCPKNDLFSSF
jgi:hypothetical protein